MASCTRPLYHEAVLHVTSFTDNHIILIPPHNLSSPFSIIAAGPEMICEYELNENREKLQEHIQKSVFGIAFSFYDFICTCLSIIRIVGAMVLC